MFGLVSLRSVLDPIIFRGPLAADTVGALESHIQDNLGANLISRQWQHVTQAGYG